MSEEEAAVRAMRALVRAEQDRGIRMGLRYAAHVLERKGMPDSAARLLKTQLSRVRAKVEG